MKPLTYDCIKAINIINRNILLHNLDLREIKVLTEVGSGPFIYNPIIPILAGAEEVIVWCRDTSYGKSEEILSAFNSITADIKHKANITLRSNVRPVEDIKRADIVTNSGMIRPIDSHFISNMKTNAVVPIMYEAWEIRESDIDIAACKFRGIKVAGTWENHPDLKVFDYTGILAVKTILNSDVEIYQSNIFIWSNDDFGKKAQIAFNALGASNVWLSTDLDSFYQNLHMLDALYICDYHETRPYFGKNAIFDVAKIMSIKPDIAIIHLYGNIDCELLNELNMKIRPQKNGYANVMTNTLSYVGLEPLLRLQTAGYKVGEDLLKNKENDLIQSL